MGGCENRRCVLARTADRRRPAGAAVVRGLAAPVALASFAPHSGDRRSIILLSWCGPEPKCVARSSHQRWSGEAAVSRRHPGCSSARGSEHPFEACFARASEDVVVRTKAELLIGQKGSHRRTLASPGASNGSALEPVYVAGPTRTATHGVHMHMNCWTSSRMYGGAASRQSVWRLIPRRGPRARAEGEDPDIGRRADDDL